MPRPGKKLRALEMAFGQSWQEVVLEWSRRPLNQTQIAAAWSAIVPGFRFCQQDVSDYRRAAERQINGAQA